VETVGEADALAEVSPKVQGLLNLLGALEAAPPRLVVGISSIIGITGMAGNAWYAFSNEALALALQRWRAAHPGAEAVALAYSVWAEVGMGARMGSTRHLARLGVSAIPPDAGVACFLHAALRRTTAAQLVVAGRLGGLDTWRSPRPSTPPASRFVQDVRALEPGVELVTRARLTLEDDPYLADHRFRESHLFPTVLGLEAMGQAVAMVLGLQELGSLRIVDLELTRPIVVDGGGTEIELRAVVLERSAASEPLSVRVGIATEATGFRHDHFAGTFVLEGARPDAAGELPSIPAGPLDLEPRTELYGGLLFQGPMFQRLEAVWRLDARGSTTTIRRARRGRWFSDRFSQETILGDPAARDALLQTAQLSLRGTLLPVGIDALHLHSLDRGDEPLVARTVITSRTAAAATCDVTAVTGDRHAAVERLVGYRLKQVEDGDGAPEPEELADPGPRDARLFEIAVAAACEGLGVSAPRRALAFTPGLSRLDRSDRRLRERALLQEVTREALATAEAGDRRAEGELAIGWREDGKPLARGAGGAIDLSLAHDRSHCLCVAGRGRQGCDLEPLAGRSRPEWLRLLGGRREGLLADLVAGGDAADEAGTRVWCALEAATKALGSGGAELTAVRRAGRSVLLRAELGRESVLVATLPLALTRPPARMVALTAAEPAPARPQAAGDVAGDLRSRFRVTFKDVTTPLRRVQFDAFADWMGRARELATVGIGKELVADFASGRWGMVTNHSDVRILGRLGCLDLVESRLRVARAYGRCGSTVDLQFDWFRIGEDGGEERVASSDMTTTWVEIVGPALVEVRPFPGYMQRLVDSYLAAGAGAGEGARALPPGAEERLGDAIYLAPDAPRVEPELARATFETSSAESNLVGNVYYASYYHWQERLVDRVFHRLAASPPGGASGAAGELTCLRSGVGHLREAMPGDRIEVAMALRALHRRGVKLQFEFHRLAEDGGRVKLAVGEYCGIWTDATGAPADLPSSCVVSVAGRLAVAA
jgi:acyl-CoA thioesterase FadM